MLPAGNLANLLTLPARHFAVIDAGQQRVRILVASVTRGRPRVRQTVVIDSFEQGTTSPEEIREEVRQQLRRIAPEALILVVPQHQVLRQILDIPPTDPGHIRAVVEREASNIGGLSESQWAFDSSRLRPFGRLAHPLAAAFCRQDHLQDLIAAWTDDDKLVFEVRASGDAIAAAFSAAAPDVRDAVLVDLGADHTSITLVIDTQPVFATSIPTGSAAFTRALATDRGCSQESAEILKRSEVLPTEDAAALPALNAALRSWLAELERTLREWQNDHPDMAQAVRNWTVYLAGGGSLQPGLVEWLGKLAPRQISAWPQHPKEGDAIPADFVCAWGAFLLSLGLSGTAPSLLPSEHRTYWKRQRFWRVLLLSNFLLAALLAWVLIAAASRQTQALAAKRSWKDRATHALQSAHDIRIVAEGFNNRMDALRPILEAERQTVETLQVLAVLQNRRTNAQHWYVLLADAQSYAVGSNSFPPPPPPRSPEARFATPTPTAQTNPPSLARAFIAEICLVPQGEQMRQSLSELIGELKQYPLFRNVDIVAAERRKLLVSTNLIFPERHFALELNLSESELLPSVPLPRLTLTNREPARSGFRTAPRMATEVPAPAPSTATPTVTNSHPGRPR